VQISSISSGRYRRTGAGPPCRWAPEKKSSSPGSAMSWETPTRGLTLTTYTAEPGSASAEKLTVLASWAATADGGRSETTADTT
jgi:hypothetical protein